MGRVGRECEVARPTSPVVKAAQQRRQENRENGGGGQKSARRPSPPVVIPVCYDIKGAAAELHISERKLWQLMDAGQLEFFKVGTRRLVSRAALERFADGGGAPTPTGQERRPAS